MNKKTISIIILALILIIVGVVFGLQKNKAPVESEKVGGFTIKSEKDNVIEEKEVETKKGFKIADVDKDSKIDTSNWKTYRNEKFGFEVRYPSWSRRCSPFNNPIIDISKCQAYEWNDRVMEKGEYNAEDYKLSINLGPVPMEDIGGYVIQIRENTNIEFKYANKIIEFKNEGKSYIMIIYKMNDFTNNNKSFEKFLSSIKFF